MSTTRSLSQQCQSLNTQDRTKWMTAFLVVTIFLAISVTSLVCYIIKLRRRLNDIPSDRPGAGDAVELQPMDDENRSPQGQGQKKIFERTLGQTSDIANQESAKVMEAEAYMELQSRDDKNTEYMGLESNKSTADQSDYDQTVDNESLVYDYADPGNTDHKYENIAVS